MGALQDYQAGNIDHPTYLARFAEEQRAREQRAKLAALSQAGASGRYDPNLIASEQALAHSSYQRAQQDAARRAELNRQQAATRARQKREQDALLAKKRQQQADANARIAAGQADAAAHAASRREALKIQQQQLQVQQAAERQTMTEQVIAVRAEEEAFSARVSELTEAARQEMIAETGRVIAPELEGSVISAAMGYAQAEEDFKAGLRDTPIPDVFMNLIGYEAQEGLLNVYLPSLPKPPSDTGYGDKVEAPAAVYIPRLPTPPPDTGYGDKVEGPAAVYTPRLPTPPPDTGYGDGSLPQDSLSSIFGLLAADEDAGTPPTVIEGEGGLAELLSPGRLLLLAVVGLATGVWLTS